MKSIDLKKDSVNKIFWYFAIPSVLAIITQSTAGFIDSIFVGKYVGTDGLTSITLVMPIIMLLAGIGTMLSIGGVALSGIHKGAGDEKKSNHFFVLTTLLVLIASLLGTIIIWLSIDKFGSMLGAKGTTLTYIIDYAKTLSIFFVCFLLNFSFTFFIKLDGRPVLVIISVLIGTLINIVLDYIFIKEFNWGMQGAALATGLSQLIPFFIMVYIVIKHTSWKFVKIKINAKDIKDIAFNGSSELLSMGSASITGFVFNYLIAKYIGLEGVAAFSVSLQVSSIATGVFYGFSEAISSPVSFNIGAKEHMRVKSFRKKSCLSNFISGLVIISIIYLFNDSIVSIFIRDDSIKDIASHILTIYTSAYVLYGVNISIITYFTAINSPIVSCLLSIIKSLAAPIIGMYLLPVFLGDYGLFYSILFAEVITSCVAFMILKSYEFGRYGIKNTSSLSSSSI